MKKVTLESAKKEGKHALLNALGLVGGVLVMRVAGRFLPMAGGWITPAVGIATGYAGRIMGNDEVKEISSGVMAAGTVVLAKKGFDLLSAKVPALKTLSDNIPTLNGLGNWPATVDLRALRGGMGQYQEAQVVSSRLLR